MNYEQGPSIKEMGLILGGNGKKSHFEKDSKWLHLGKLFLSVATAVQRWSEPGRGLPIGYRCYYFR